MTHSDPLPAAQARVQRAWLADGLTDLTLALYFLLPGLFHLGLAWFDPQTPARAAFILLMTALLVAGPWLARWTVIRLRNRLFASRSGYSVPASHPFVVRPWSAGLALGLLALLTLWILRGVPGWGPAVLLAGSGLLAGAILGGVGWKYGRRRYVALGVLFVAGGLLAARAAADLGSGFALLYAGFAVLLALNGIASLLGFLRTHPRVQSEEAA